MRGYGRYRLAITFHSRPREPMLLSPPPYGAEPAIDHMVTERRNRRRAHRHGVVSQPAAEHLGKPFALRFDAVVAGRLELFLDLSQLRPHPLADRCPSEHEAAAVSTGRAIVREPKEVERLRLAEPSGAAGGDGLLAEFDEPRLFGMEAKVELAHARREVFKKPFRIVLMLEADNRVVRIADDDHVARRLALSPLTNPEIVDVVQVDVCEERRNYRALRRPLHRFDLSALLKHPCRQPFADQPDNPPITDPMLNEPYQPCVADRVEGSGRRLPIAMTFRRP